jgi:hypothetical protein
MQIPKNEILKLVESKQGKEAAQRAARELPDLVHHLEHAPLLAKFGINPEELLSKVGGAEGLEQKLTGLLGGEEGAKPKPATPSPPSGGQTST